MSNNLVGITKSQNLALKLRLSPNKEQKSFLDKTVESYKVLREAEKSQEKSESLSKDTDCVLPTEMLANLALSYAQ